MGCVDWNCKICRNLSVFPQSHPTWGAWIETLVDYYDYWKYRVAPRVGCVDWNNFKSVIIKQSFCRTPRGVRGLKQSINDLGRDVTAVAPRVGCVDWNVFCPLRLTAKTVAPRVGCVDWNITSIVLKISSTVAPRVGCVDWNIHFLAVCLCGYCRTPRGVRGLKRSIILSVSLLDKIPVKELLANNDYKNVKGLNYKQLSISLF